MHVTIRILYCMIRGSNTTLSGMPPQGMSSTSRPPTAARWSGLCGAADLRVSITHPVSQFQKVWHAGHHITGHPSTLCDGALHIGHGRRQSVSIRRIVRSVSESQTCGTPSVVGPWQWMHVRRCKPHTDGVRRAAAGLIERMGKRGHALRVGWEALAGHYRSSHASARLSKVEATRRIIPVSARLWTSIYGVIRPQQETTRTWKSRSLRLFLYVVLKKVSPRMTRVPPRSHLCPQVARLHIRPRAYVRSQAFEHKRHVAYRNRIRVPCDQSLQHTSQSIDQVNLPHLVDFVAGLRLCQNVEKKWWRIRNARDLFRLLMRRGMCLNLQRLIFLAVGSRLDFESTRGPRLGSSPHTHAQ